MEASTAAPPAGMEPVKPPEPQAPPKAAAKPAPKPKAAAAPEAEVATTKNRDYSVFTDLTLKVSTKPDQKAAGEALAALLPQGAEEVFVLVRIGRTQALDPKKALIELGQVRELDGNYEVISNGSINRYEGVRTSQKVSVSIG